MEFTITREQLDEMQKYSKLYGYMQQSFTKTYFSIGEGQFSFFFHGQKGALKSSFTIDAIVEPKKYFQIDYSKWVNALSKLSFYKEVSLRITEKFMKVFVTGSSDIINLGIIPCEKNSSEIDIIESYISDYYTRTQDTQQTITLTEHAISAINTATAMFSTVGNNNAIALFPSYVMYADRSLVLKAHLQDNLPITDKIVLHRFTAGVLPHLYASHPTISFAENFDVLVWDDQQGTQMVLVSEPCEINLPSEEDLAAIGPQNDSGTLIVPHTELQVCLNFFNGFYEASVWKPITFTITAHKEAALYYKHPTTEITKNLGTTGDRDGEFIVGSETLLKLVNKAVNLVDEGQITFLYDDEAPGVSCNIAGLYDVVFAKLVE